MLGLLFALGLTVLAALDQGFDVPANDGWVTDKAGLLRPEEERSLEAMMESYRVGSGQEIALLIVPDLQGRTVEEFALVVAREWKIGDRETSSGALLLVAAAERELRIEVGRGLEGTLTDSIAGRIIRDVIVPEFKAQRMYPGLRLGIETIHAALGGDYGPLEQRSRGRKGQAFGSGIAFLVIMILLSRGRRRRGGFGSALPWLVAAQMGGRSHGGGSSGGYSGGGFGGGGGFSGGGASGSW